MAATLDDLVNVLTDIARMVAALPKQADEVMKVQMKVQEESTIRTVMNLKGLSEEDAKALIESWKV